MAPFSDSSLFIPQWGCREISKSMKEEKISKKKKKKLVPQKKKKKKKFPISLSLSLSLLPSNHNPRKVIPLFLCPAQCSAFLFFPQAHCWLLSFQLEVKWNSSISFFSFFFQIHPASFIMAAQKKQVCFLSSLFFWSFGLGY